MLLAIDTGNTNITIGIFDGDQIVKSWRIASDVKRSEDEYGIIIKNLIEDSGFINSVDSCIIASVVVQLTEILKIAVKKYLNIYALNVNHKIKTGIEIIADNPAEVGADRIANACAAVHLYQGAVIVVDFGTATTFDIVNSNKQFVGGIITAGMKIQANALSQYTSKLPKVRIEAPKSILGRNTIDAMLSGIVKGHAVMIEGLLKETEEALGEKTTIIATGGYSSIISKYMKRKFDEINPDLTLIGLKILYHLNKTQI